MIFRTETGSAYKWDQAAATLRRVRGHEDKTHELRGDEQPIHVVAVVDPPEVSKSARFLLSGLAPGVVTLRTTTCVTEVEL